MAEIVVTIANKRDRLGMRCLLVAITSSVNLDDRINYGAAYKFIDQAAQSFKDTLLFVYNKKPLIFCVSVPNNTADMEEMRLTLERNLTQLQAWLTQLEQE